MTLTFDLARTLLAPPTAAEQALIDTLTAISSVTHQYAIKLPNGRWWRKLSTRLASPNHTTPTVFHDRARAADEMFDVIGQAVGDYGVRPEDYTPQLMAREVLIRGNEISTGPWYPVETVR
ncbi:hypothetical protein IU459_32820 [Nocardia amamiensis]|uniref:Uncharacterized protein n=1 Tax=Nocardia amamiensis TaxID=404578 RepID=A0ABS0D0D8_9NOCA|nr:hypothetical protein [Nocardia amamiensis]MBF6302289.1 hypothetical protein [Nocardia amamiensis]